MTKRDAQKLARRFGMKILRDPSGAATRLMVESHDQMPDLDALLGQEHGVCRQQMLGIGWMYTIEIPEGWCDSWGWKEDD